MLTSQVLGDIALPDDFEVPVEHAPRSLDGSVLLTGTTGFLGSQLLRELLESTRATVYCLVRASSADDGRRRIHDALVSTGFAAPTEEQVMRIVPVVGDLAAPSLRLSQDAFDRLAELVDVVIHNGALVRFLSPYRLLRAPNVLGTREVLRFATHRRTKWLHVVSTLAILHGASSSTGPGESSPTEPAVTPAFGSSTAEHDDITPLGASLRQGYALSKWAAEMLLGEARRRGAPITIYRLGYVSGLASTGVSSTDDARTLFMKACRQLGAAPQIDRMMDLAPVDAVARAIRVLAGSDREPDTYHLFNRRSPSWLDVVESLSAVGPRLALVSYAAWRAKLDAVPPGPDAWLRLFREHGTLGWLVDGLGVDCRRTDAILAEHGFIWPCIDAAIVERYLRYYASVKAL